LKKPPIISLNSGQVPVTAVSASPGEDGRPLGWYESVAA
jgi:hypothetical protein